MERLVRTFKAWQYRGGRPQGWARIENRLWARIFAIGRWHRAAALEVRGRRSFTFPVALVHRDGGRFVVAMLGERTNWARNVRANEGRAVLIQRQRRDVVLIEVPISQRAAIIRQYLDIAPAARPHFPVRRGDGEESFERIAPDYPAFRITEPSPVMCP